MSKRLLSQIISLAAIVKESGAEIPTENLVFHLDAQTGIYTDAGITEATNGQAIQQINEQSGAGITATNTEVGYQATYAVNSVNGLNSIRLENNNALDTYLLSSSVNVTNLFTVHYVLKKDALADAALIMAAYQQLLSDENNVIYLLQSTTLSGGNSQSDQWSVVSFVCRKGDPSQHASYNAEVFINGISTGKFSSSAPATQSIDRLFQRPSARTGEYNVGDVLIYDAVQSIADVGDTQNALNTKYGELFLPINEALPAPPIVGFTTLEWYHNPDYNTYSDLSTTVASNLDYVRGNKVTTGTFASVFQHSAGKQMQYKNTVLPNSKASYYKGGADNMRMSEERVFTGSESFVAYSVHKREDTGSMAIFGKEANANNSIMDWSGGTFYFKTNTQTASTSGVPTTLNTVVRAYVVDRTAQLFRIYENGTQITSFDITALTDDTTFDLMFNRHTYGTGKVDFGITLLYRGLHDAADVVTVSDWLNAYYGDLIY